MKTECPVCQTPADIDPPTGDFSSITCPRCGAFKISGTAERLVEVRLAGNALGRGWLSHFIRTAVEAGMLKMVTSDNLDDLMSGNPPRRPG